MIDTEGRTPLVFAADNEQFRIVEILLKKIWNQTDTLISVLRATDNYGKSVVHGLSKSGRIDDIVKLLKVAENQPDLLRDLLIGKDEDGLTALHWALKHWRDGNQYIQTVKVSITPTFCDTLFHSVMRAAFL